MDADFIQSYDSSSGAGGGKGFVFEERVRNKYLGRGEGRWGAGPAPIQAEGNAMEGVIRRVGRLLMYERKCGEEEIASLPQG